MLIIFITCLGLLAGVPEIRAEAEQEPSAEAAEAWTDKIKFSGSLWEYYLWQDNIFFFEGNKDSWLESIGRLGAQADFTDHFSAQLQVLIEGTHGDADTLTAVGKDGANVELELANLTYKKIFDLPLAVTLGRQNLLYGDGFLVWDGYSDRKAVWINPINSFNAAKISVTPGPLILDLFFASTIIDYLNFEVLLGDLAIIAGDRNLWGVNGNLKTESFGEWDLAVFIKDDKSALRSDTTALSLRGTYETPTEVALTITGEIVGEWGTTMVRNDSLAATEQNRQSVGGHIDGTVTFKAVKFSPYLKVRYAYFPGDDPDTPGTNEAFDPMFYGWQGWGSWFVGSINSFNLHNTNERALMLEAGFSPTQTTTLQIQYYDFWLDREVTPNAGKKWAEEINIIFNWFPNEYFFTGMEFGWTRPKGAAKAHPGFGTKNTTEVVAWAGVQF